MSSPGAAGARRSRRRRRQRFRGVELAAPPLSSAFAAFDHRAPRRRSRAPLIGLVAALALAGVTVYLLRGATRCWSGSTTAGAAASRRIRPAGRLLTTRIPAQGTLPGATRASRCCRSSLDAASQDPVKARDCRRAGRGLPSGGQPRRRHGSAKPLTPPQLPRWPLHAWKRRGSGRRRRLGPARVRNRRALVRGLLRGRACAVCRRPACGGHPVARISGIAQRPATVRLGPAPAPGLPRALAPGGATAALGSVSRPRTPGAPPAAGGICRRGAPPPLVRAKRLVHRLRAPRVVASRPPPAAGVAAGGARATAIQRITWEAAHGGGTVVTSVGQRRVPPPAPGPKTFASPARRRAK